MVSTYNLHQKACLYDNPAAKAPQPYSTVVLLHHPAYVNTESSQQILSLPRLDSPASSSDSIQYGIHYGTFMAICYIITGNRPGFLSSKDLSLGNTVVTNVPPDEVHEFDDLLTGEAYYYYILGQPSNDPYRVLYEFRDWAFPSYEDLRTQSFWQGWISVFTIRPPGPKEDREVSTVTQKVKSRDDGCCLTGVKMECGCQGAHVIPSHELKWFEKQKMILYAKEQEYGKDYTTRTSNMFLLRNDIHAMFDSQYFILAPKRGVLTTHFLSTVPAPACYHLHNVEFRNPDNLAAHFVFARIAWTVLPMTRRFVTLLSPGGKIPKRRRGNRDSDAGEGSRSKQKRDHTPGNLTSATSEQSDVTSSGELNHDDDNNMDSQSTQSNDTNYDDDQLEKDKQQAMSTFPDVFGHHRDSGSFEGSGRSSRALSFSHLEPERAEAALYDALTLSWYPGVGKTQRLKKEYIENHPEVRATTGDCRIIEPGSIESILGL